MKGHSFSFSVLLVRLLKCLTMIAVACPGPGHSIIRTWIGDRNAKIESVGVDCNGLIFDERIYPAAIWQDHRTCSRIVLPETGVIILSANASFSFDPSENQCVRISYTGNNFAHVPANWLPVEANRAVSDLARMPCQWDEIVVSEDTTAFAIDGALMEVDVKAITMMGHKLRSQADVNALDESHLGVAFDISLRLVPNNTCTQETCVCQEDVYADFCTATEHRSLLPNEATCTDPVQPDAFCHLICGAYLQVHRADPIIASLLQFLKTQSGVDFAYEIVHDLDDIAQIVIVDKWGETGGGYALQVMDNLRILFASSFPKHSLHHMMELSSWEHAMPERVVYYAVSGAPIVVYRFWSSTVGLILISFLITVLLFVGIYVNFMTRLGQAYSAATTLRPFVFARFSNVVDEQEDDDDDNGGRVDLSLHPDTSSNGRESRRSSSFEQKASSLERTDCAFDNLLYGKPIIDEQQQQDADERKRREKMRSNDEEMQELLFMGKSRCEE